MPGTPQDRFATALGYSHHAGNITMPFAVGQPMRMPNNFPILHPNQVVRPTSAAPTSATGPVRIFGYGYHGNGNNGARTSTKSARGPHEPSDKAAATSWLAYECQIRGFNPEVRLLQQADGTYTCTIVVQGIVVEGGKAFNAATEAKQHTAAKARKMVQKWPKSGIPPTMSGGGAAHVATTDTHRQFNGTVRRQDELPGQMGQGKKGNVEKQNKSRAGAFQPVPMASSGVNMSNPVEARAFVEGYKMGQRASMRDTQTMATGHPLAPGILKRTRSRSPPSTRSNMGSNHYRNRSPVGREFITSVNPDRNCSPPRYYNGNRRDRSLPSTDRYRPHPVDHNYGRLREGNY